MKKERGVASRSHVLCRPLEPDLTGEEDEKYCAWCELLQPGAHVPAEHVDHIVPFSFFQNLTALIGIFKALCCP